MIQFQANHRRRDVVFIERNFHEFGPEHSTDSFSDYSRVPVDPEEQDVAVDHRPDDRQVGATDEDNFLRELEQLGERHHKPLARFHEECYISSNLTSDINEPVTINEAFSGEHSAE